jgi:Carboxypeptidase regulatory-like domain/TonB dependent receptor-like, beta-barrel
MPWRPWLTIIVWMLPVTVRAQSTLASVSGTIYDEQHAVLPGAAITLSSLDTGQTRSVGSDSAGRYRVLGLTPGRYEMRVALEGFAIDVQSDLLLTISAEAQRDVTLRVAGVSQAVTVAGATPQVAISATALGRTISTREIDELPVAARDFTTLALLTPGILGNYSTNRGSDSTIVASGQIGRNNTFVLDGLSLDAHLGSGVRGGVSLDTVKEFVALSDGFSAEYGHAAGAVISVLTRSGTNDLAGRLFYYHRDDAWDATDAAASLTDPPGQKTTLEQKIGGGFLGGPVVRNRAFFFGSMELTRRDSDSIVTSPLLQLFRPGAPTHLPVRFTNPQTFARSDVIAGPRNILVLRSRFDRRLSTNQAVERQPEGFVAPERRQDRSTRNWEIGGTDQHAIGSSGLSELRFQVANRIIEANTDRYCAGCAAENRNGILLGKSDVAPEKSRERRWQLTETLSYAPSDTLGVHAIKGGVDVSAIDINGFQPAGFDGAFTFGGAGSNRPFDANDRTTYPTLYRRNTGEAFYDLGTRLYAVFVQDQWNPTARLTLNLGVRWDYEDGIRAARDANNVAPRIGVAFDPSGTGRTTIRGTYGLYYDAVLFQALVNTVRGSQVTRFQVMNPGYPDSLGPNPNRTGPVVNAAPNGRRFADAIRTPYTEQASIGVRRLEERLAMTVDAVWARGRNLLRTRDANYRDPQRGRPDPTFQEITVRETEGRSLYRALLVGLEKRQARRHAFAVAYTLSRAERDTEDWDFIPQDQRDYRAEWGPGSSDVRHRLAGSVDVVLGLGVRIGAIATAFSALPYNVTTGIDDNGDTYLTDRPAGVWRNSARGSSFFQVDIRVAKAVRAGSRRIELIAESFNIANRRNWTGYDGILRNATFGKPTDAASAREVQLGVRLDF